MQYMCITVKAIYNIKSNAWLNYLTNDPYGRGGRSKKLSFNWLFTQPALHIGSRL